MARFTSFLIFVCCWLSCCELATTVEACPYLHKTSERRHQANDEPDYVRPDHIQQKIGPDLSQKNMGPNQQQRELQTGTSETSLASMIELLLDDIMRIVNSLLRTTSETTPSPAEVTDATIQNSIAAAKNDIQEILSDDLSNELVRLLFHDCVGGMCDGCVDTSNPENFGLGNPIADMESIVEQYADVLTRADLWVLAAYTALERQQNNGGGVSFDLEYVGRPSCGEPTRGPDRQLPSAHLTTQGLIDYFREQFDFDERETTAIMGAHTLGRAVPENSGFNGQGGWVPQEDNLNNQFYTVLLGNGATFQQQLQDNSDLQDFPDQFLWRRTGGGGGGGGNRRDLQRGRGNLFMLNADMALVADMEDFIDSETGAVSCTLGGSCPDSELLGFATEFARSNAAWIGAFHDAYIKLTNVGCEGVCRAI